MKVTLSRREGTESGECVVIWEKGVDTKFRTESQMMYHIKQALIAQGYDVIKKEMVKDGHLTDEGKYYIRTRNWTEPDTFCIFDNEYYLRQGHLDLMESGEIKLVVYYNFIDEASKMDELKDEAAEMAIYRNHKLTEWVYLSNPSAKNKQAYTTCENCGFGIHIQTSPPLGELDIHGEMIRNTCKGRRR